MAIEVDFMVIVLTVEVEVAATVMLGANEYRC